MEAIPHTLKVGQRVKLKDLPDNFYTTIYTDSEGWVRNLSEDEFGYPLVYIEWDRNHWTYNQQRDSLMMEAHFEPVEEETMATDEDEYKEFLEFKKFKKSQEQGNNTEPEQQGESEEATNLRHHALDSLKDASGFFLVSVTEKDGQVIPELVTVQPENAKSRDVLNINALKVGFNVAQNYIVRSFNEGD